jgi:hypothetical protein
MKGGYRDGAGRKKGFAALEAEKAREFIAQKVSASLGQIINNLIVQAKKGNIQAAKELFDRAWGRSQTQIALSDDRQVPVVPSEIAASIQRGLLKVYGPTALTSGVIDPAV